VSQTLLRRRHRVWPGHDSEIIGELNPGSRSGLLLVAFDTEVKDSAEDTHQK